MNYATTYKKIVLGFTLFLVFAGISFYSPAIARADSTNPCGPSYTVTGPDANQDYTCTQGNSSIVVNASGQPVSGGTSAGASVNANSQSTSVNTACSGLYAFFYDPVTCVGRSAATFLGTALIWISSWILTIAGLLFNWVITNTILQFGNVVSSSVLTAINLAWSVFRDISNIVIIGMFTFIAIMTILGSTDYGAKKMISRVLIVAVLINFSLLFTKIIIDASNFTAIQFLNAAASNTACTGCTQLNQTSPSGDSGSTGQTAGIAGAFMQYAGANSLGDTYGALTAVANDPQNGGWYALIYGVLISILEIVAALVLFYGAFMLIARAILMIFLMITSSIAFASYLVPSLSNSYGWSAWWSTLFRNALFAPFLAILLWVTLTVAQAYNGAAGGSLGQLVTNPTGSSLNVAALFGYVLVIGLLFLSIRIASSFSTHVGGLGVGQDIWSRFAENASKTGSGVWSTIRPRPLAQWASNRQQSSAAEANEARLNAAKARSSGNFNDALKFDKLAAQKSRTANRLGNLATASTVLGAPKKVASQEAQKALPREEARKEVASADDIRKLVDDSSKNMQALTAQIEKEVRSNESLQEEHTKNMEEATRTASEQNAKALKPIEERIKKLNDDMSRGGIDDSHKQELQKQLLESEESRKSELRHQDERLKRAHQTAMLKTAGSDLASKELKEVAERFKQEQEQGDNVSLTIQKTQEVSSKTPGLPPSVSIRSGGSGQSTSSGPPRLSPPLAANDDVAKTLRSPGTSIRKMISGPNPNEQRNPEGGLTH
ncbi:MAG: hypothetical protein P4L81_00760 [Candidatus Pacebacteria bacterium]|nr:hypothetical protein [Candidatus Paceibacterota bacterium]